VERFFTNIFKEIQKVINCGTKDFVASSLTQLYKTVSTLDFATSLTQLYKTVSMAALSIVKRGGICSVIEMKVGNLSETMKKS
jgi:hypothetical protein